VDIKYKPNAVAVTGLTRLDRDGKEYKEANTG